MTLIARRSPLTGKLNEMDIPVTHAQWTAWQTGTLIQVAMPNLTPEQREFLMTGLLPEEWDEAVGDDNEE